MSDHPNSTSAQISLGRTACLPHALSADNDDLFPGEIERWLNEGGSVIADKPRPLCLSGADDDEQAYNPSAITFFPESHVHITRTTARRHPRRRHQALVRPMTNGKRTCRGRLARPGYPKGSAGACSGWPDHSLNPFI
jgi:hypothetical protein